MRISVLVMLLCFYACSGKKKDGNQVAEGHEELYALPAPVAKLDVEFKRIVLAATNDLHGHYSPHTLTFKDKHHSQEQSMQIGGVDYLASYLKILRSQYQNVLLVDSGDIVSSAKENTKQVAQFYEGLNYDAITFGLSDFNRPGRQGSSLIQDFARDVKTPVLLSNLYELRTGRGVEWKGVKPYILKEIDGVKIGVLGVVPDDIVSLTPLDNRVGLYVENMVKNTLHYARLLRSLGAELVVVITHHGVECGESIARAKKLPLKKVNFDPAKEDVCSLNGILGDYIRRLPPHFIDVIVGGRHHQKMANIINGTVVLSGFEDGQSLNLAEFYFDKKSGKVVPEKTVVHQPIMICQEFFKETKDCYTEDSSVDHKERIPATFLGQEVSPDLEVRKKFESHFFSKKTTFFNRPPVEEILESFSADLIYSQTGSGDTQLVTIEMTGKELSRLLDERFNAGLTDGWKPNPFHPQNNELHLLISGKKINADQSYRILSDLEELQKDFHLRRLIAQTGTRSHYHMSWNTLILNSDEVDMTVASPQRQ